MLDVIVTVFMNSCKCNKVLMLTLYLLFDLYKIYIYVVSYICLRTGYDKVHISIILSGMLSSGKQ